MAAIKNGADPARPFGRSSSITLNKFGDLLCQRSHRFITVGTKVPEMVLKTAVIFENLPFNCYGFLTGRVALQFRSEVMRCLQWCNDFLGIVGCKPDSDETLFN